MTRRTAIGVVSGAAVGAALTGIFSISRYRGVVLRKLTQFAIPAPNPGVFLSSFDNRVGISPDGRHIAFNTAVGGPAFYLNARRTGTQAVQRSPCGRISVFSPDGRWVGFFAFGGNTVIQKLALSGGAPATIVQSRGRITGIP